MPIPATILNTFAPIGLKEMEGVKLMDRTDTKFTFSSQQLPYILESVRDHYYVLEMHGKRSFTYKTLYYDTVNFNLYTHHHSGKLNRYKIRHRSYVESATAFLEVKFKNNKGRTIKERIKQREVPMQWKENEKTFLQKKLPFDPETLKPCLWVNYSRITLVNKASAERVTIDMNLGFENEGKQFNFAHLVIAEVKQEKKQPSVFLETMKELKIREGSISKYCLGMAVLKTGIKKNNFKEKIQSLRHITGYDYNTIAN